MPTSPVTRRSILRAAAAPWILSTNAAAAAPRPNFIFLLTDDQSYSTMSITGNPFMKTPALDRIGREGALFTNSFVAMSLCAPSRACNLSGLYPHKNGIINNTIRWNQATPTLPGLLHDTGYQTAYIGKFHMDGDDRVQPGFDYWAAQVNQGQYVNPRKNINGTWTDMQGYDTTIVTDQAISFMNAARKKQNPFCVWMGYKACHGPFTPAPGHENDFSNVEFKPPASFFIDDEGKPQRVRNKSQNPERIKQAAAGKGNRKKAAPGDPPDSLEKWAARERDQYRCLMGVEDSVARIFQFLEENKLADDTIVVFAGDNGFFHGEHGLHGKMEAYEEALRVPTMVRYPRLIKAGQKVASFTANVDLAPSILDFCGAKIPASMQGRSWKPLVTGAKPSQPWRSEFVYTMHGNDAARPTVKALRTDRYKLILNLNPSDKTELYDLSKDPGEMKNLALESGNASLIESLKKRLATEMKKLEDPATIV